jgi:hypothetical protein
MVTIDRIDRDSQALCCACFDAVDGYWPVALPGPSTALPRPIEEQEAGKNFAIMHATDKTPRVFISPRY